MNAEPAIWTFAYRNPRANRFQRVANWSGTWEKAGQVADRFRTLHPELQVWTTPTAEAEANGYVMPADIANILVESGKRVRIADTGKLPADLMPPTARETVQYMKAVNALTLAQMLALRSIIRTEVARITELDQWIRQLQAGRQSFTVAVRADNGAEHTEVITLDPPNRFGHQRITGNTGHDYGQLWEGDSGLIFLDIDGKYTCHKDTPDALALAVRVDLRSRCKITRRYSDGTEVAKTVHLEPLNMDGRYELADRETGEFLGEIAVNESGYRALGFDYSNGREEYVDLGTYATTQQAAQAIANYLDGLMTDDSGDDSETLYPGEEY